MNEELINGLKQSKKMSNEISKRVEDSKRTE